jgi:septal ring factor EnvC (AmiA/AmiB activator)
MMRAMNRAGKSSLIMFAATLCVALGAHAVLADELSTKDCPTTMSKSECQDQVDAYNQLQDEIAGLNSQIADTQAKKGTLQGDVTALNAQIAAAEAQIKQKTIAITQLGGQITQKTAHIGELESKISEGHDSLASLLRRQNEIDDLSLPEIALGADSAFDLFKDVDQMSAVSAGLDEEFNNIRNAKAETESERKALTEKQGAEQDAKYAVETTKQKVSNDKAEKAQLLAITTNQETQYKAVLADRQAQASAIRARLFPLRDAAAIQFGDALKYAQAAEAKTGTSAALILAILTQESNLGANVGQCYVTDSPNPGDGVGKNTGTPFSGVMNPTRDEPPFLELAKTLGFDPHKQVVSCPIAGVGGWGGAMGPAQFIPSTWALYAPRIGAGANPWNPQDAIMAMALLLADDGASAGGYTASFTAAARYYAGWNGPNTSAGKSYGAQVMARVAGIQQDIDFLKDN